LKTARQLSIIPKTFKVDIPQALASEVLRCKSDEEVRQVGIEWCTAQCKELIAHGVPSIHFYAMAATDSVKQVAKAIY
jgi:methylenetetrahydrofolate reductase (NADPH)